MNIHLHGLSCLMENDSNAHQHSPTESGARLTIISVPSMASSSQISLVDIYYSGS
jgi:hypothetical protein